MAENTIHGDLRHKTCVVLGGRGFIGRSLVTRLLRLGTWIVRVADSAQSLQIQPADESDSILEDALSSGRASYHCIDVRDKSQIVKAMEGSYVVFYMGAADLHSHDYFYCYKVIVQGARNVISACRESGIRQLIYNSTADVIFNGSQDICDGDESLSCPWKFESMLLDFKAQAEGLIRLANNRNRLLTCVLRASIVFGPGDTEFVPLLVDLAKSGCSKFIVGKGENMSDFTYVENVAYAHICAAEALDSRAELVAGKEFFITNLEPMRFWDFITRIIGGLGYPRPSIKLPTQLVLNVFSLLKLTQEKLGFGFGSYSDRAHGFIQLALRTRTFNCNAAKMHIGYSPVVSLEDGIESTVQWFSCAARDSTSEESDDSTDESKAAKLLGCGKAAEILLWRDEKKTFACFVLMNLLFYWFFFSGKTFTSSTAQLLLLFAIVLYGYGIAPPDMFPDKRMPSSSFIVSESAMRDISRRIVCTWNRGFRNVKSLGKAGDWGRFFKIAGTLYALKLIMSHSLASLLFTAMSFLFTAFLVYEQYEIEIHRLARVLFKCLIGLKKVLMERLPSSATPFLHSRRVSSSSSQRMYM